MEMFDLMPLACAINGKQLCMHGGIGQEVTSFQRINRINRKREPCSEDMLLDLLWADPAEDNEAKDSYFQLNPERSCSVYFGAKPVANLLKREKLKHIVRAHQCVRLGYQHHYLFGKKREPPVTTIFSAPNYCGKGNRAAYIKTEADGQLEIIQFNEAPDKPLVLRNNDNVFSYYMVDLAVWLDEFLFVLFDHVEKLELDTSREKRVLTRSMSKLSECEEEKKYYEKVTAESIGIV